MSLSRALLVPRLALLKQPRGLGTSSVLRSGTEYWWGPEQAAGREEVGYGVNGDPSYEDRVDYWYPAIRFRRDDDVIRPIRQKEAGDWKKLSLDEKKMLYRYSFRQTWSEFQAPTGYWKLVTATVLGVIGLSFTYTTIINHWASYDLPGTSINDWKETEVERMLITQKGMPNSPADYYDYENHRWKK